jgi:hypothetical protein
MRGLFALLAVPAALHAQNPVVRLVVSDSLGQRVPFAYAHLGSGAGRVASDSGVVEFRSDAKDSLKFIVRRIGFAPFGGWIRRDTVSGEYRVAINQLPRQLSQVDVRGLPDGPLVRAGFYDRLERARRGATVARFITPEEIELRNPTRITQLLENENIVKIKRLHGNWSVVSGRANCPMALVVDGTAMRGTAEEILTRDGEIEIQDIMRQPRMMRFSGSERRTAAEREFLSVRLSIDDIVTSLSVAAIEIYSSVAGAPPELLRNTAGETCGLVVVWTGSRR